MDIVNDLEKTLKYLLLILRYCLSIWRIRGKLQEAQKQNAFLDIHNINLDCYTLD